MTLVAHVQPNRALAVKFDDVNSFQVVIAAVRTADAPPMPKRSTAAARQVTCATFGKLFQPRHDRPSPADRTEIFRLLVALPKFQFVGDKLVDGRPKSFSH